MPADYTTAGSLIAVLLFLAPIIGVLMLLKWIAFRCIDFFAQN